MDSDKTFSSSLIRSKLISDGINLRKGLTLKLKHLYSLTLTFSFKVYATPVFIFNSTFFYPLKLSPFSYHTIIASCTSCNEPDSVSADLKKNLCREKRNGNQKETEPRRTKKAKNIKISIKKCCLCERSI